MPKQKKKKKAKHTCQFGVWKVPDDAVVVDGGIVSGDETDYEQEYRHQPKREEPDDH